MAINMECPRCHNSFTTSASSCRYLCSDCDGTNAAIKAEEDRWAALSVDKKLDELRQMVLGIKAAQSWDGRIG